MNIALIGNPNVGKTTVFNAVCKKNRHTGNWTGKTVEKAQGKAEIGGKSVYITDLPGTYSFSCYSKEEEEALFALKKADGAVIVADAAFLGRSLKICYEVLSLGMPAVLCINYKDEAEKKGISFDAGILEKLLGIEVVYISAKQKSDIAHLKKSMARMKKSEKSFPRDMQEKELWARLVLKDIGYTKKPRNTALDRIFTGRITGTLLLVFLVSGVFWITLYGANIPSDALSGIFSELLKSISRALYSSGAPEALAELIMQTLSITTTVVSVMLPPMAIFFPLFSFLEETGYLPRAAFCADRAFACAGADGRQALTTCMGFGCNAAGVIGARIIADKKKRFIAVIANSFIPCNGKLPMMMTLLTVFAALLEINNTAFAALLFIPFVVMGVLLSLAASKILSRCVYKTKGSLFALELPQMRMANPLKILSKTLTDKILKVLLRAVTSAAPAGAVIWLLLSVETGGETLMRQFCDILQPIGAFMGLDGVMLAAFILGLPANEIVLPIALMIYSSDTAFFAGDELQIFIQNGWTHITALCALLFAVCHFPCATTLICAAKETKSAKAALLAFFLPSGFGFAITSIIAFVLNA